MLRSGRVYFLDETEDEPTCQRWEVRLDDDATEARYDFQFWAACGELSLCGPDTRVVTSDEAGEVQEDVRGGTPETSKREILGLCPGGVQVGDDGWYPTREACERGR